MGGIMDAVMGQDSPDVPQQQEYSNAAYPYRDQANQYLTQTNARAGSFVNNPFMQGLMGEFASPKSQSPVDSQQEVQQNYQSLFGRKADQPGMEHWINSGLTGQALTDEMTLAALNAPEGGGDRATYLNRPVQQPTARQSLFNNRGVTSGMGGTRAPVYDAMATPIELDGGNLF